MQQIKLLFKIIGNRKAALCLAIFSIFISFIEFIGLALIAPYISISTSQAIPDNNYVNSIVEVLSINSFNEFILYFSLFMFLFYLVRFFLNIFYNYRMINFLNKTKHLCMTSLFDHYVHIDYKEFVQKNTSDLKKLVFMESQSAQIIMQSLFTVISEVVVLVLLLSLIVYVDWKLAFFVIILFGLVFLVIKLLLSRKIVSMSHERVEFSRGMLKHLDEMLNNFKFMKLIGAEKIKKNDFFKNSFGAYRIGSKYELLNQLPRFAIETLGIWTIVGIILYSIYFNPSKEIITIIGVYAVVFYRALPSLNKIIPSFNNFIYHKNTINIIYESLQVMGENYQTLNDVDFMQKIELKNIEFSYDKKVLFEDFSFEVKKGEKLALIGESGSGKSTLVDIIMGIIKINKGNIIIDGKELIEDQMASWRQKFGYIPQSIYLFDGTVGENIAFGRDYDEAKIEGVLKQANILDFLNQKKGINTIVGEGGIQLSGGQKQRIGIARALYNNPEILVLDEATSALDNETENKIMQEIYSNCDNKTLIIIAHRLSTTGQCDRVIKIKNGKAEDE